MCDLNEDKLAAKVEMERIQKKILDGRCMKCKETQAVVVVRVKDPMCQECFLGYASHKFRSTLGKSKLVRANDKVLLAISGGHSSVAMLHFVKEALSERAQKRLKFVTAVIFVDESILVESGKEDLEKSKTFVKSMADEFGFPYHYVPIYQNSSSTELENEHLKSEFLQKFASISTLTAKTDYITSLRMELITSTALKHGYKKVMVGDNATTLSIKLLCDVSQGKGLNIPKDMAVGDDRYEGLTIVRPMRELSSKECAMYNRLSNIRLEAIPNLHTKQDCSSSLQRQTEEFIIGLQAEFPSTVSTVFRTGDKLCADENIAQSEDTCCLCHGILSVDEENSKEKNDSNSCGEGGCCGSSDECGSNKFKLSAADVKSQLCYGCNLTFQDMNFKIECLPSYVLDSITASLKRKKMKASIQDFLLE